jgi:hypothetical protein
MRKGLIVLVVLSAVSLATLAKQHAPDRPVRVQVRVRGNHVHFRKSTPESLDNSNIVRYTERRETFLADAREYGPSEIPGKTGEWYHLTNPASQEDGWVAGDYVVPIDQADVLRLKQLGSARSTGESLWASPGLANALSIIASVLAIATIFSEVVQKYSRRQVQAKLPSGALPSNVIAFSSQSTNELAQVTFGASGGTPWLYRPRVRHQRGGKRSA